MDHLAEPFIQFEHPLVSDLLGDIQAFAVLADDDIEARKALDDISETVAAELSAARERARISANPPAG